MQADLANSFRARVPEIRERWTTLLHVEPVTTPLGTPGALVHLLDWTLDEILAGLAALPPRRGSRHAKFSKDQRACVCTRNPLLMYFAAGEQAVREALVLAQAALPSLDPLERDASLAELDLVFQDIAQREIATFCGVCQHRGSTAICPLVPFEATPAHSP